MVGLFEEPNFIAVLKEEPTKEVQLYIPLEDMEVASHEGEFVHSRDTEEVITSRAEARSKIIDKYEKAYLSRYCEYANVAWEDIIFRGIDTSHADIAEAYKKGIIFPH